jgi:hypothetical protein
MIVKLEDDEVTICNVIGRMRSLIARNHGVKDAKMGKQSGIEADIQGLMAEYAFAKQFNTFPDMGLTPRSGSADGLLDKYRYDIKSTTYKTGRLLATMKDNPDVDMYILGIVDGNTVDFVGYAMKTDLVKPENIKDLGHGKVYCMDQSQLKKFKI